MKLLITNPTLNDEQQEEVNEILGRHVQLYKKYHKNEGLGAYVEYLKDAHNLALVSVNMGSLEITVQCPTLESLESLWNDYCSGHLNEVAERYLVTDDMKRKLNLETVRLKTTIKDENYLMCKKALTQISGDF